MAGVKTPAFCYNCFMIQSAPLLRRAIADDAAVLTALALRSKASNGYDAAFMEACREELTYSAATQAGGETWVAELGGRLAGFIDVRLVDGAAEVFAMFVEPDLKRSGVGRALWQQLETSARHLGASAVMLDADPAAVAFYQAMGCATIGERPSGSIRGRMLPRMRKTLQ
jgi:ribosomal protein S18 acetylase RimI-like enzyme